MLSGREYLASRAQRQYPKAPGFQSLNNPFFKEI